MSKTNQIANVADLDEKRTERPQPPKSSRAAQIAERVPAVANAATASDTIFTDGCLAYGYGQGVGSLTLMALRQLVDTNGQLYEDRVIVGLLRAPMHAIRQIRTCIDEIEKLEAQHVANSVAAMERPAGTLSH